jgi:hypothetical protein
MKRKDAIRRLDELSDVLDRSRLVTNAPITATEAEAIRLGAIAGLVEALDMLRKPEPPYDAEEQARELLGSCLDVYVRHFTRGGSDE